MPCVLLDARIRAAPVVRVVWRSSPPASIGCAMEPRLNKRAGAGTAERSRFEGPI